MTGGQRPDWFWELAIAVNAAFKGLLGSMGESGHICASTEAVEGEVDVDAGWEAALARLCALTGLAVHDGDVVVVADKVVSAALGRIGPRGVLAEPDPKTVPAHRLPALAAEWSARLGFEVTAQHLLLADEFRADQATLGTDDPNARCAQIAAALRQAHGVAVDVVISDTDTGLDTRTPIIGTLTIGATPIGATAGVNLYEAMRCATAAEFVRGHHRMIPVVVCRPARRRAVRPGMSEERYPGFLDAGREKGLTHA
ncbi:hypothetical protein KGA66_17340 [Actinocrinis puniceicyclus]|uniref:Uncharacterized protein n=1 Tax=Actinocrinis puniceicyclus TaxID=977794 RepID=A0A8J8BDT6_9ACTN|nr:hypothetical protein [Actinocrinis puniceicyclus]MBS2964825.1 hypothetical protein [Actinocrinis puniceicyclus]